MSADEKRIREFAYQIWESEGKPTGQDARHWQMARKLAEAEALAPDKSTARKAAKPKLPKVDGATDPDASTAKAKPATKPAAKPAAKASSKPAAAPAAKPAAKPEAVKGKAAAPSTQAEQPAKSKPAAKPATKKTGKPSAP